MNLFCRKLKHSLITILLQSHFYTFLPCIFFGLCLQEKFHDSGKVPWLCKTMTVETVHNCWKLPWLWKISMTVEVLCVCGKVLWLWKSFLIVEKFCDWLWKSSIAGEKFHDCGKAWLQKFYFKEAYAYK